MSRITYSSNPNDWANPSHVLNSTEGDTTANARKTTTSGAHTTAREGPHKCGALCCPCMLEYQNNQVILVGDILVLCFCYGNLETHGGWRQYKKLDTNPLYYGTRPKHITYIYMAAGVALMFYRRSYKINASRTSLLENRCCSLPLEPTT